MNRIDEIRSNLDIDYQKEERYWQRRSIVCAILAGLLFLAFCALAIVGNQTASIWLFAESKPDSRRMRNRTCRSFAQVDGESSARL